MRKQIFFLIIFIGSQILLKAQPCPLSFSTFTHYSGPTYANQLTSADFNNDGIADIALTDVMSPRFTVFMGVGNGSFTMPAQIFSIQSSGGTGDIVAGNFDYDGKIDLAIGLGTNGDIGIFKGDGTGVFTMVGGVSAGPFNSVKSMVTTDFNQDGKLDLAVANGNLHIFLGLGFCSFSAPQTFTLGSTPFGITVGDFDTDGKKDLAVTLQYSSCVSVFMGDGTGSFTGPTNFTTNPQPLRISNGDINNDGKSDLLMSRQDSFYVSILPGLGGGTFGPALKLNTQNFVGDVLLKDLNADNKIDLAVSSYSSSSIKTFKGNNTFTFQPYTEYAVESFPNRIISAEFGGDNLPDIATATQIILGVSVIINNTCIEPIDIGMNEYEKKYSETILFPNPFSNEITITNLQQNSKLIVLNALGQTVFEKNISEANSKINLSELSKGIYFVRINSGQTFKLVKE